MRADALESSPRPRSGRTSAIGGFKTVNVLTTTERGLYMLILTELGIERWPRLRFAQPPFQTEIKMIASPAWTNLGGAYNGMG